MIGDTCHCSLLVRDAYVLTMDAEKRVYRPGAIAIGGGEILAVGVDDQISPGFHPDRVISARGAVVHPGFVEAHTHVSMHTLRGVIGPDKRRSASAAVRFVVDWYDSVDDEDEEAATLLACIEMARNGTTCFVEAGTVLEPDAAAAAAHAVGIRAFLADPYLWDVRGIATGGPDIKRAPADTQRALSMLGTQLKRGSDPKALVRGHVALYGIGTASDDLLLAAKALADRSGTVLNMHQSWIELDTSDDDMRFGRHPLTHYSEIGALGGNCNFVHMNIVREDEIAAILESGMSITWCPSASMFQGVGATFRGRHLELFQQGVNVALGSDATNWCGSFDIGMQAFLAVLTAREKTQRIALTSEDALRLATINGAHAVGAADRIGSLEVGKRADLVIRRQDLPEAQPDLDPILNVVYSSQSKSVDTVIIDGEVIVEQGRTTRVDEEEVYERASTSARRVLARMKQSD